MKSVNKLDTPLIKMRLSALDRNLQSCRVESPYSAPKGGSARGGQGCGSGRLFLPVRSL